MTFNSKFPHLTARRFFYADPDIGGGKTYSLNQHLAHPFTGKCIVGIQSIELAKEIETTLVMEGISVLRIDTEAFPFHPANPELTCTVRLNAALASGNYQVIICNQEVASRAQEPYSRQYALFMDEIPPVYERIFLDGIVTSRNQVSSYITSEKTSIDDYRRIKLTDEGEWFLENDRHEKMVRAEKALRMAMKKVQQTDFFDVYAEETIYRAFKDGIEPSVVLHAVLKPSAYDRFASVTILGANFLWSLMNLIWSKHYGVQFSLHQEIMQNVRYQSLKAIPAKDGTRKPKKATVYYHSEKNCSKTLFNQVDYQPTFDASHDAVKKLMADLGYPEGTESLVFLNNEPKGYAGEFYWKDENAKKLSSAARGWDAYKEIDFAIFLAACNEHPDTCNFLKAFYDISRAEVDRATALDRAYQAVGRSSFRDGDPDRPCHMIFFEYRAAKFVADLGGLGEPIFLDTGLPGLVAKEPKTNAERQQKKRHTANFEALDEIEPYEGFNRRVWSHQKCHNPKDNFAATWAEYVLGTYQQAITYVPASKSAAKMYREGDFGSSLDHKIKGVILSTKVITFDFDDVSGDPQEFSNWLASQGISHVITNSYRSRPGAWRFRVDIPLDRPVNSYVYAHIAAHLIMDMEAAFGTGVFVDDSTVRHMHAKFFAPGISEFEGGNIFIDGTVFAEGSEEPRFLDVMSYADRDPIEKKKAVLETESQPVTTHAASSGVEAILDQHAVPVGYAKGSENFHLAAVDLLFKAWLSPQEAIDVLHLNRFRFGDGNDRDAAYVVNYILENKRAA